MIITKYGHCCLLIEINGKRVLTDPGAFSAGYENLTNIDVIVVSHEHGDHLHIPAVKILLVQNPNAEIVANSSVARLLEVEGITCTIIEGEAKAICKDVSIEAQDAKHVEIFEDFGMVQNTAYRIGDEFFYPGDSYAIPEKYVRVLALPVAGPWLKVVEAIHYAQTLRPEIAVPVHDAVLSNEGKAVHYRLFTTKLADSNIVFKPLIDGEPTEL